MPVSVRSGQLVNPVLTNLQRQYRPDGFVADQLAPRIPVGNETFQYVTWDLYSFFGADVDSTLPDRAEAKEIDIQPSTAAGVAEEYALKVSVSAREMRNVDNILQLRASKSAALETRLAIAREVRVANLLRKTTSGGKLNLGSTPANNWNVDAATIEADVTTAIEAVEDAIGVTPNTIVVPRKVAHAIAQQQDIREIFKYTVDGRQLLGAGSNILPPEIWGLRVLIPMSYKATNAQGATDAISDIWGDDVRVLYVNPNSGLFNPSVAYTFQAAPPEVRTWRSNDPNVEYILNSQGVLLEDVVAPDAGYELKDLLS